jgi:hypothetical protein
MHDDARRTLSRLPVQEASRGPGLVGKADRVRNGQMRYLGEIRRERIRRAKSQASMRSRSILHIGQEGARHQAWLIGFDQFFCGVLL